MRENKSGSSHRTTDQTDADMGTRPTFGDDTGTSRSVLEELRKYPFFFDDDEPADTYSAHAARVGMARDATPPRSPALPTEIRPLPTCTSLSKTCLEMTNKAAGSARETPPPETPVSLAGRHTAAITRTQSTAPMPSAAPALPVAAIDTVTTQETVAPAAHTSQAPQLAQEAWYNRVPTGVSLVAIIVYFLIGGVALLGTGLVLGGLGGTLMAIFGLAVTSVAAFVTWQELISTGG